VSQYRGLDKVKMVCYNKNRAKNQAKIIKVLFLIYFGCKILFVRTQIGV